MSRFIEIEIANKKRVAINVNHIESFWPTTDGKGTIIYMVDYGGEDGAGSYTAKCYYEIFKSTLEQLSP